MAAGGGISGSYGTGLATNNTSWNPTSGFTQTPGVNGALEATQMQSQGSAQQSAQNIANTQANAAMYPATLAQQRFNQVFPYLQGKLNSFSPTGAGSSTATANEPRINTSPVWNSQQIQQQVNTSRAANDAATQSQQRNLAATMGGQGFGSNSPLAMALGTGMQNQNLQTNTANETGIRNNAAQVNQQAVFGEQQAASSQYAQRQQEALQAQSILAGQSNALLAALASLSH